MHNALRPFFSKRVIRVGAALDRIQTGIEVMSRGRTHRRRLKTVGEQHAFRGQLVDVRRVCLTAIAPDIMKSAVIRHDQQQVRFPFRISGPARVGKKQYA